MNNPIDEFFANKTELVQLLAQAHAKADQCSAWPATTKLREENPYHEIKRDISKLLDKVRGL